METRTGDNMRQFTFFGLVLAIGVLTAPVSAATVTGSSAVLSSTPDPTTPGVFDYTITLKNSSSSPASIGTFWYAWTAVPFYDFLHTSPLSVTNPTGWTDTITNIGSTDGYAIEWVSSSSSNNVPIDGSLTYKFTSTDTPASVNGDSFFYPTIPVGTSFVYSGGPFSDAGEQFVLTAAPTVSSVPEPSTLTLGILALASSYAYSRFKRKGKRMA
jgi:hypothetical protein